MLIDYPQQRSSGATPEPSTRAPCLSFVFLLTLAFFVVTGIVFPWSLYPADPVRFAMLLNPEPTEPIPPLQLYGTAALALSPWIILSPWSILWLVRPQGGGYDMLSFRLLVALIVGLPLLLVMYFGLFSGLAYIFERRRRLGLLVLAVLCGLSAGYGVLTVKEIHVDPSQRLDGLLERMRAASHKRPFPEGTKRYYQSASFWNTKAVSPFRERQDPPIFRVVSGGHTIDVWFYESSRYPSPQWREAKCKAWSASHAMPRLTAIAHDIWRCTFSQSSIESATGRPPGTRSVFQDFGFLDRERRIYAEAFDSYPVEQLTSPDQLSTFFAYYRPHAAPHAPSR